MSETEQSIIEKMAAEKILLEDWKKADKQFKTCVRFTAFFFFFSVVSFILNYTDMVTDAFAYFVLLPLACLMFAFSVLAFSITARRVTEKMQKIIEFKY
jgi:hypothetical protein